MNAHKIIFFFLAICVVLGGAAVLGHAMGQHFESVAVAVAIGFVVGMPLKLLSEHFGRQATVEGFFQPDKWDQMRFIYRLLFALAYAVLAWLILESARADSNGVSYYFAFISGTMFAVAGAALLPRRLTGNGPINE